MRKLIQWYRNTSSVGRLITALFLLALLAAASYNFNWELAPVLIGGTVTMFVVEVMLTRPSLIAATVFTLFHALFVTVYVYNIIKSMSGYKTDNELVLIEAMTYAGAFVSSIVILAGCWYLANGRYWFNVMVSYALYAFAAIGLVLVSLNPLYIMFVAVLLPVVWILLRKYVLYRRFNPDSIALIPRRKADTAAYNKLNKLLEADDGFTMDGINVFRSGGYIYLTYSLTPSTDIEFTHKGVFMDELDVSMVMEHLTAKLAYLSRETKVNHKRFVPIVYVTNSKMNRGVTPVNFRTRQKPDVVAGTVFFCTSKSITRLIHQVKTKLKPMSDEEQKRFSSYRVEH